MHVSIVVCDHYLERSRKGGDVGGSQRSRSEGSDRTVASWASTARNVVRVVARCRTSEGSAAIAGTVTPPTWTVKVAPGAVVPGEQ